MIRTSGNHLQKGEVIKLLGKKFPPMVWESNGRKIYYFQVEINGVRCLLDTAFFYKRVQQFNCLTVDRALSKENLFDMWQYLMHRRFMISRVEYHPIPVFDENGLPTDKERLIKSFYLKHLYKS
jgi:hypothetical protein